MNEIDVVKKLNVDVELFSEQELYETLDKIKLARHMFKILKDVDDRRNELLKLEIEIIIRLFEIGAKLPKKIDKKIAKMFFDRRSDVRWWEKEFPDSKTAQEICRAVQRKEHLEQVEKLGENIFLQTKDSESRLVLNLNQRMLKDAFITLTAGLDEETSVSQITDGIISYFNIDPDKQINEENTALRTGIDKAVQDLMNEYDQVGIGELQAPKFVTFLTEFGTYHRVPFKVATLGQFRSMIDIRQERLEALAKRIKQLEDCYEYIQNINLLGHDYSIAEIIKTHVEHEVEAKDE